MKKIFTILVLTFAILLAFNSEIVAPGTSSRPLTVKQKMNEVNQELELELSSEAKNILKKNKIHVDRGSNNFYLIFTEYTILEDENGERYPIMGLTGTYNSIRKVVITASGKNTITLKCYEVDGGTSSATFAFTQRRVKIN